VAGSVVWSLLAASQLVTHHIAAPVMTKVKRDVCQVSCARQCSSIVTPKQAAESMSSHTVSASSRPCASRPTCWRER
jgi:hypothetical protein